MSSLTDLVQVIPPDVAVEPEDIFASAPGILFTDDLRVNHGDPGSTIVYTSHKYGPISLRTADPDLDDERRLFSHYLWNAGVQMAELISSHDRHWSVDGARLLELGAGVGIGGIVAVRAGAAEVCISDYPSQVVLDNIRRNVTNNVGSAHAQRCSVQGYAWGDLTGTFASQHQHHFTRIIASDCLWMPGEHINLARSMLHFLALGTDARCFVTAGFHTGRAKLVAFFDTVLEQGLDVVGLYEQDADGHRRDFLRERDGGREDHAGRNKWLVIAQLCRRT